MVDAAEVADVLCLGYANRGSRELDKGVYEWQFAEAAAYFNFRRDFLARYSGGFVTGQLDYKSEETPKHGDPSIQAVIDAMRVHFRNWWSRANVSREGGFRKPDGFGIAPEAKVIEIIEVKPLKNYNDGVTQLKEMITITSAAIADYCREREIQGQSAMIQTYGTKVQGSSWRPKNEESVFPLPYAGENNEISWICFKPCRRVIDSAPPVDGVILYEIHTISKPQYQQHMARLPNDMKRRLAQAHAARTKGNLLRAPWAENYMKTNAADARQMRELVVAVGIVAAVAIVALAIVVAAPIVAGAAPEIAAAAELAAEAESVEVIVGGTYRTAAQKIRISLAEYAASESGEALVEAATKGAAR
jgi:hypothetical protein